MNLFVITAVVLTGLAAAAVVWPLLRKTNGVPGAPVAAVVLGVSLPAAVLLIYLSASNYDWSAPATATHGSRNGNGNLTNIDDMIAKLENRLQAEPDNVAGWLLLGRSYAQLQQIEKSRRAYRRALALEPSTEAKLGVAEADIMLDRDNLKRDAGRLVEEVLAVEPDNPKALFYGGMVAMTRNDIDLFRERWQRLLALSPPDEIRHVIEAQLARTGITPGQIKPARQTGAPDPGIDVSVSVTDELAKRIRPGAILYLVARDPNRRGPPLAVVRHEAAGFPVSLNISDANAMIPGQPMLSLPRVHLIARITNSGKPVAQPGDLFGEKTFITGKNRGEGITIVIDRIVD